MHARQLIRDVVHTTLTGLATSGPRAYAGRVLPLQATELPLLQIATDGEDIVAANIGSTWQRTLALTVTAKAAAAADLDNVLDTMCEEVEVALAGNNTLNGLIHLLALEAIAVELTGEGDQAIGALTLTYRLTYFTTATAPQTAL